MQILYTVLAVLGWILAAILLILAFVLFSRVSVRVKYNGDFSIYGGLNFIKIKLLPQKKKEEKKKKKKKPKKEKKKSKNKNKKHVLPTEKEADEKKGSVKDTLSMVLDMIKRFGEMTGKSGKIKISELKIIVSKPEAEQTAVYFGICCGIVSNILAACSLFGKSTIKEENVSVTPDFCGEKSRAIVDVTISFRVISLLLCVLIPYFNHKILTEGKKENDK